MQLPITGSYPWPIGQKVIARHWVPTMTRELFAQTHVALEFGTNPLGQLERHFSLKAYFFYPGQP